MVARAGSDAVAYSTQNPWLGVLAAIVVSCLLAMLHGYVGIHQRGNQLVSGMAINISVSGLTFVLAQAIYHLGGRTPTLDQARFAVIELPGAQAVAEVPLLGWFIGKFVGGHTLLAYLAFVMIPIVQWVIYHTRFGLRLRAVGENPHWRASWPSRSRPRRLACRL